MSKRNLFEELRQGIEEARGYDRGEIPLRTVEMTAPNVQAIREKTGLSQTRFAALLGVNLRTLQNWERGRRRPIGPARTLLRLVERNPKVLEGLQSG